MCAWLGTLGRQEIWGTAKDVKSMLSFKKWPLVAELKLKVPKKANLDFSTATTGHFENVNIFDMMLFC